VPVWRDCLQNSNSEIGRIDIIEIIIMEILNLRKSLFWIQDFFKGSPISKHYSEVHNIIDGFPSQSSKELINKNIQNIIKHAQETTPYYKDLGNKFNIDSYPVIDKNIVRNNYQAFMAQTYNNKPHIKMTTSGSTGTPFTVLQDRNKKLRHYADTLFFSRLAGYDLGHKLYYLKIWSENNRKTKLEAWKQNFVPIDVLRLTDDVISDLVVNLKRGRTDMGILGYASALDAIVQYLIKKNADTIRSNVKSIISTSESLSSFTREAMTRYFQIPTISRYSNLENGILAQQCFKSEEFHINIASYYIEIFDIEKDTPVNPGTLGRIVVTDYFNYAMPLIRYDTGDLGELAEESECGIRTPVLKRIEGRKLDQIFDTRGNLISSYLVYKNMWRYTDLNQYQLIQEDEKEYSIKLNPKGIFRREKELIAEFKKYLGDDAIIKIEYVDEIPLLASGKRKKIVNNFIKK